MAAHFKRYIGCVVANLRRITVWLVNLGGTNYVLKEVLGVDKTTGGRSAIGLRCVHRLATLSGSPQGGGRTSFAARLGTSGVGVEVVGTVERCPAVIARRDANGGRVWAVGRPARFVLGAR